MASLTETAHHTRRIIKWGTILIIILFALRISIKLATQAWEKFYPPKPPEPTTAFGKLPLISFPENKDLPDFTFRLETIEGKLPTLKKVEKVYFMPRNIYTYLTLEKARDKAKLMGFSGKPTKLENISETTYHWQTEEATPSSLTMEVINQNFNLHYFYEKDQSLLSLESLITSEKALSETKKFLSKIGFLPNDINTGEANFIYLRYSPPNLIEVASIAEADFVRVNLLRKKIEDLPVLPSNLHHSNITALISKAKKKRIIDLNYTYFPIDLEVWGTYILKDTTEAWNELKEGRGYIASLGDNWSGQVTIRRVYLAYYDPPTHQNFLQPIFVFEGDKDFTAYVAAVKSSN